MPPSVPVLRLTAKTSGVASRSFRPCLKGIELAAAGGSCRQDGGAYCRAGRPGTAFRRGRPGGSRPPADAQSPGPLAGGSAQRAGRPFPVLAAKARCRRAPPAGHRAPALAAHADMVVAGSGPGPAGGYPRRSRGCRCRSHTRPAQVSPGWKR
jgi:hypothetical protein